MKKSVIICVIGVFLPLVLLCRSAVAETAADLSQAEGLYKAGQYAQAEQPYLKALRTADANKPAEADAAVTAAKGLALVYVATDRLPQAKEAIQPLLKRPTPHALHEIVDAAKTINKLAQVRQVYQDMIAAQPDDPGVIWLRTGLGIASVQLADDQAVQATLQDIVTKHGSDDRVVEAYGQIAWAYRKLNQYDKALKINQYTVDHWPQKPRAAYAQQGILICQLALKNLPAADQAFDVLVQRFGKDPEASKIVLWSGFAYQDANQPERAYKVYGVVVQNYPDSPEATTAQLRLTAASVQAEDPNGMRRNIDTLLKLKVSPDKAESLRLAAQELVWKQFGYATRQTRQQEMPAAIDACLVAVANNILVSWPKSDAALWAQRALATVALHRGDDPNVQAAINSLTTDYAERKDAPAALAFLADYCYELKRYDRAAQMHQYICERWPQREDVVLSEIKLAMIQIRQGNDAAGGAMYRKILTEHPNHPKLPDVVLMAGEAYFDKGLDLTKRTPDGAKKGVPAKLPEAAKAPLRQAIAKWNDITAGPSPSASSSAAQAQYDTVIAYSLLEERQSLLDAGARLLQQWPNYAEGWRVLPLMVKAYKEEIRAGNMSAAEGQTAIDSLNTQLLEKNPSYPGATQIRTALRKSQAAAAARSRDKASEEKGGQR